MRKVGATRQTMILEKNNYTYNAQLQTMRCIYRDDEGFVKGAFCIREINFNMIAFLYTLITYEYLV